MREKNRKIITENEVIKEKIKKKKEQYYEKKKNKEKKIERQKL